MKRCYSSILGAIACVGVLAATAMAEKAPSSSGGDEVGIQANCDLTGYKNGVQTLSPPTAIPDNNATGVTVGPIQLAEDGLRIADVVIDLQMAHTWIGDLLITALYDETCDGVIDATATLVGRPGRAVGASCTTQGTPFGCSSNLLCTANLLFDDTAANALGLTAANVCVGGDTTNNPGGCYKPTGPCASPLAVFENRRKGGCWYLNVKDLAGGDLGTICGWSVHILNQPSVGVAPVSWGHAKALYN